MSATPPSECDRLWATRPASARGVRALRSDAGWSFAHCLGSMSPSTSLPRVRVGVHSTVRQVPAEACSNGRPGPAEACSIERQMAVSREVGAARHREACSTTARTGPHSHCPGGGSHDGRSPTHRANHSKGGPNVPSTWTPGTHTSLHPRHQRRARGPCCCPPNRYVGSPGPRSPNHHRRYHPDDRSRSFPGESPSSCSRIRTRTRTRSHTRGGSSRSGRSRTGRSRRPIRTAHNQAGSGPSADPNTG